MPEYNKPNRNQFLVKPEKKEEANNKPKLKSQIVRHRIVTLYKVLGVLAVLALLSVALYFHWKNIVYTDYEVKQEYQWSKASDAKCVDLTGTILAYGKDGMTCTDTKGNVIWNQTYEMQEPIVKTCQNVVAAGDYNGREIYICNTTEILGKIDTTMPIRDFCVASNGVVAAVLDDSTITAIYLYSVTGEALAYFKTTMSKSGYPIAIDIAQDGKQVAVSYVKAEDGKVVSSIGFYNFAAVGQNYTDNMVGAYGYSDAVIPIISFMNNDTVFGVADHKLMFFQGKQKPVNIADIWIDDEIQSVFYNDMYVGLVFYNKTGETTYLLQVYDTVGDKIKEIPFNLAYDEIQFGAEGILIYNENECQIYDWNHLLKFSDTFTNKVHCFISTGKVDRYTLVTEETIQTIQLK